MRKKTVLVIDDDEMNLQMPDTDGIETLRQIRDDANELAAMKRIVEENFPHDVTTADNLLELLDKLNLPEVEEPPPAIDETPRPLSKNLRSRRLPKKSPNPS